MVPVVKGVVPVVTVLYPCEDPVPVEGALPVVKVVHLFVKVLWRCANVSHMLKGP